MTSAKLTLALVGCGGMGRRHIKGLHKLRSIDALPFRLAAVCDLLPANAKLAADLAEELLGERPQMFHSVEEARNAVGPIDALIVTTAPDTHAEVGIAALEAGTNVMVEKPIALTVRQGLSLIEAADRTDLKLAVAENYRRDPMNRLAKAIIDSGALGSIYLAIQSSSGSGEKVIITPWRHQRRSGGIVVDMGIHYADLFEYFLGPASKLFGMNAIVDKQRVDEAGALHDVDAEDLSVGVAQFENGAIANWMINLAGRGQGHFIRTVYGTGGTMEIPQDRSGKPIRLSLRQNGEDTDITPDEQLALVPDFRLDEVTAKLFGGERLGRYQLDFPDIDANLLAIEQSDFAASILENRPPEVDGMGGLRALAISYGFIEADRLGRALDVETLARGEDSPYQDELMALAAGGVR